MHPRMEWTHPRPNAQRRLVLQPLRPPHGQVAEARQRVRAILGAVAEGASVTWLKVHLQGVLRVLESGPESSR